MRMAFGIVLGLLTWLACGTSTLAAPPPVLLVFGDSLSAGYGLRSGEAWPVLLQARLERLGHPQRVVNASVSGETTAGGVARLPALLREHEPRVVVLELGANDGLRGLPLAALRANLRTLVAAIRHAGAAVVVLPMRLPPNYGPAYASGFANAFSELPGQDAGVSLTPFFLQDVALNPALLQTDGLHPTALAQPIILDAIWPGIAAVLEAPQQVKQ